jgi:hypothetical protein
MKKEEKSAECCQPDMPFKHHHCHCHCHHHGQSGAIYCLGVVGALFYFLQNAATFSLVMIGIGKSIFWPAILMFKLLTYLHM